LRLDKRLFECLLLVDCAQSLHAPHLRYSRG
jgi:hypothetical protein